MLMKNLIKIKLIIILLLSIILTACSQPIPLPISCVDIPDNLEKKQQIQLENKDKIVKTVDLQLEKSKLKINIETVTDMKKRVKPNFKVLKVQILVPRDPEENFTTKSLSPLLVKTDKLKGYVTGIGITSPITPDPSTNPPLVDGFIPVTIKKINDKWVGEAVAYFVVPLGNNRIITIEGYNTYIYLPPESGLLPGAVIKGVFNVTETGIDNFSVDWYNTATAKIIENLINLDPLLASLINYNDLQNYVNTLTNPTSPDPALYPYTFITHPSLINCEKIAEEIINLNKNNPPGSTPILPNYNKPEMFITPKTLTGTVTIFNSCSSRSGEARYINVSVCDPASSYPGWIYQGVIPAGPKTIFTYTINGITPNVPGIPWKTRADISVTINGSSANLREYGWIDFFNESESYINFEFYV